MFGFDKEIIKSFDAIVRSTQHGMRILECGSKPSIPSATRASEQLIVDEVQPSTMHRGASYAQAMTRSRSAEEGGVVAALQYEHKGQ